MSGGSSKQIGAGEAMFSTPDQMNGLQLFAASEGVTSDDVNRLRNLRKFKNVYSGNYEKFSPEDQAIFDRYQAYTEKGNLSRTAISEELKQREKTPGRAQTILTQDVNKTILGGA
jgi:hypothetical protein